tara:strand:+ start:2177 stop:2317 length:141 start_codon:yes stop_codon:yes gene_type:complete
MSDSDWANVRIRSDLKKQIEKHIKKNPSFGGLSDYVSYVVRKELGA